MDETAVNEKQEQLLSLKKSKDNSERDRQSYEGRWAKNINIVKGIFPADEMARSKVRGRSKLYFRKVWSNNMRLLAALHSAFIRELDNFKIEGRGEEDVVKAKILHFMTEYRRDKMMRSQGLFMKFIHGFLDILECGCAPGILHWDKEKDSPDFTPFPPEQVYPDFAGAVAQDMQFIHFEAFITMDEMKRNGFENLDCASPVTAPYNAVRAARNVNHRDPLQNPQENEYAAPGKHNHGEQEASANGKYRIFHSFYRKGGKVYSCVTNGDMNEYHKSPKPGKFGDRFPVVLGLALPVAHRLIGEGFPEAQEGPQESYNDTLNRRKDNVALAMNKSTIVSRFGNVDLQSLVNSRAGAFTLADDVDAVKERNIQDVTQSAYMEASVDDAMMQELSSVTDTKLGQSKNEKATTASINLQESNAKIDLFISIVGETYIRPFYSLLAYMIQKFETDETVFRVANQTFRKKNPETPLPYDIYEVDDFEADCIINIGLGTVGREVEVKNGFLLMDRMIMSNQAAANMMKLGAVPPGGMKVFDMTEVVTEIMPKLGYKDVSRFVVKIPVPPPQEGGGDPSAQGATGAMQPQIGELLDGANDLQRGGNGGI